MGKFKNHSIGLSIYRIIVSFLIVRNLLSYLNYTNLLFSDEGIIFKEEYEKIFKHYGLNWVTPYLDYVGIEGLIYLLIFLTILFGLGIGKWFVGILLFFFLVIFQLVNYKILDGSDNILLVTLPLLSLGNSYQFCTVNVISKPEQEPNLLNSLATKMFLFQISLVYFVTGIAKLKTQVWLNGSALTYILQLNEFNATRFNLTIARNVFTSAFLTYSTLIFELFFPLILVFKKLLFPWLLFGVIFHIGIFIFMRIDVFPWIMIATYFVFIDNSTYFALYKKFFKHEKTL